MILFFSGTGNSRYIARRLAAALGDELVSVNDRIKSGDTGAVRADGSVAALAACSYIDAI